MNSRSIIIDLLRGIGVLLVLIHHIFLVKPYSGDNIFLSQIYSYSNGGRVGVDLFFVVSGFLIAGLIFKELNLYGEFRALHFLIRRGFKIYPLYYVLITSGLLYYHFILNVPYAKTDLFGQIFFLANYFNSGNPPLGHLWSLSVEEHFYFFLAIFMLAFNKIKNISYVIFLSISILFFVVGFFVRAFNFENYDGDWWKVFPYSHARFDALFFGVFLCYLYNYKQESLKYILKYYRFIFVLSTGILLLNFLPSVSWKMKSVVLLGINPVSFGLILIILLDKGSHYQNIFLKSFSLIGQYSYSIYLFHPLVVTSVKLIINDSLLFFYTLSLLGSIIVGIIISKLVEIPFLNIRDKYFPSRASLSFYNQFISTSTVA